jgi:tetratricopeptide (TPR) repeat protein
MLPDREEEPIRLVVRNVMSEQERFSDPNPGPSSSGSAGRQVGAARADATALSQLNYALDPYALPPESQPSEAVEAAKRDVATSQVKGDRKGVAMAMCELARAYMGTQQYSKSVEVGRTALALCRKTGQRIGEGTSIYNLTQALLQAGEFEETITVSQEALRLVREMRVRGPIEVTLLDCLATALVKLGQHRTAIRPYEEAIALLERSGDDSQRARFLFNLAATLEHSRLDEKAAETYRKAAKVYRDAGHTRNEAIMWLNHSRLLLWSLSKYAETIPAARRAAEVFNQTGDSRNEGEALYNLANAYIGTGELEDSLAAARKSYAIRHDIGDPDDEAMSALTLGAVLVDAGRLGEAIPVNERAAALFRQLGNSEGENQALAFLQQARAEMRRQP